MVQTPVGTFNGPGANNTDQYVTVIGPILDNENITGFWVPVEEYPAVMDWWRAVGKSSVEVACEGNNKAAWRRQLGHGGQFLIIVEIYETKHEATNNQQQNLSDGTCEQIKCIFQTLTWQKGVTLSINVSSNTSTVLSTHSSTGGTI